MVSSKRHPGGEEDRQAEDRVPRQPRPRRARGQEEQRDLARRVEAQAEEDAERVHLPRLGHGVGEAPEQPVHEPARAQQLFELGLGVRPAAHVAQDAHDPHEHDQVQARDQVEEGPGHSGADHARGGLQRRAVVLHLAGQRADPDGEEQREREDHGRVPEGEEEPDAERPLAVVHELARRVVDGRDVVCVERVAQPEGVGRSPTPAVKAPPAPRLKWCGTTTPKSRPKPTTCRPMTAAARPPARAHSAGVSAARTRPITRRPSPRTRDTARRAGSA